MSKIAAPLIPFMTEQIYQNLVCSVDSLAPESIHLCDYPVANENFIDKQQEDNMDEVLKIVVLAVQPETLQILKTVSQSARCL